MKKYPHPLKGHHWDKEKVISGDLLKEVRFI